MSQLIQQNNKRQFAKLRNCEVGLCQYTLTMCILFCGLFPLAHEPPNTQQNKQVYFVFAKIAVFLLAVCLHLTVELSRGIHTLIVYRQAK